MVTSKKKPLVVTQKIKEKEAKPTASNDVLQ